MTQRTEPADGPAHWGGVFAMSLCVFALVASEFMPVSLLTPMAGDLLVSEGMAGRGIAISGGFAVLASLSISRLAGTLDRKTVLLVLTVLMGVSGAVVALAGGVVMYLLFADRFKRRGSFAPGMARVHAHLAEAQLREHGAAGGVGAAAGDELRVHLLVVGHPQDGVQRGAPRNG